MRAKSGNYSHGIKRRQWLGQLGGWTLGILATEGMRAETLKGGERPMAQSVAIPSSAQVPVIEIGIFLSTFQRSDLAGRLEAVRANGLKCVQLGMECVGLESLPDRIAPDVLDRIRDESLARQIEIAALQGTFNMGHPDPEIRREGVRRLRVLAEACRHLGVNKIHLCTGTRDRASMWKGHPENSSPEAWQDMVHCVREAVDAVKPAEVTLAFEPEVNNIVDSAVKARRLIDEIGSPLLKVTMDAANLFHRGELPRMSEILDRSFALIGHDIVMAHAKDVLRDGDAGHEAAGHGKLDYDRYLSLLYSYGFRGPLLLHSLSENQVPGCVAFLRNSMNRLSPSLEPVSQRP